MLALHILTPAHRTAPAIFEGDRVIDAQGNIGVILEFTTDPFVIVGDAEIVAYVAFEGGRLDYFHEGEIELYAA